LTLEKARQMLEAQAGFGNGYSANGARLVLAEVQRSHGQAAVDALIAELQLERAFGFHPGQDFSIYSWKKP
jgi:hypothetical protein